MSTIDMVLLAIIAWLMWSGYRKGLLVELVHTFGLVIALVASFMCLDLSTQILGRFMDVKGTMGQILSFIIVFALIIFMANALAKIVRSLIGKTIFGTMDKFAGAGLGLIKALLGLGFVFWITNKAGVSLPDDAMAESTVYPVIAHMSQKGGGYVATLIPIVQEWAVLVEELFNNSPKDGTLV